MLLSSPCCCPRASAVDTRCRGFRYLGTYPSRQFWTVLVSPVESSERSSPSDSPGARHFFRVGHNTARNERTSEVLQNPNICRCLSCQFPTGCGSRGFTLGTRLSALRLV